MALFEILVIIVGIFYGYLKTGKEDRFELFKKGVIIGLIFGFVITLFAMFVDTDLLFFSSVIGVIAFIEMVLIAILFIAGTFIGDWLEDRYRGKRQL